ncbi:MAG TPA: hypothetical protein VGR63_19090 [Casimicrobiaceae bacterium]|jgi:hypothetical protein|nr:hypothetical protein [Casimicrobiaceae bacterium]
MSDQQEAEREAVKALRAAIAALSAKIDLVQAMVEANGKKLDKIGLALGIRN